MSEKVTFQELIDSIAEQTDNTKQFTHDFLKDFVSVINEGLESDGTVNIAGFGKFKLRAMDEREGVNPQTGKKMTIPAHNKVVFKPYKDLRELVNAPYSHLEPELLDEHDGGDIVSGTGNETGEDQSPALNESTSDIKPEKKADIQSEPDEVSVTEAIPEKPAGQHSEDDNPFKFENAARQKQPVLNTDKDPEDKDKDDQDIVEYSPYVQDTDSDQPSDDMLVKLPMMQKSKIPEPENREESAAPKSSLTQPSDDAEGNPDSTDSVEQEPSVSEHESAETSEEYVETTETIESTAQVSEEIDDNEPGNINRPISSEAENKNPVNKKKNKGIRMVAAAAVLLLAVAGIWYIFMPRNVVFKNVSGMITQIADRQWYQPTTPSQPDIPSSKEPEQKEPATPNQPDREATATNAEVTVPKGQTLWSLADQEYNDPYLWPWIYDKNKTSINNPDRILAGQVLSVPVPAGNQGKLAGGDSLDVALGYVETYRWYKANNYNKAKYYLYAAKTYRGNVFDHTDVNIDKADLAFANRVR